MKIKKHLDFDAVTEKKKGKQEIVIEDDQECEDAQGEQLHEEATET